MRYSAFSDFWLSFFLSPPCRWCLWVWNTLRNPVCFWCLSTCTWFSKQFISISILMEKLVLEVSSLLELFTLCDLTLFLSQILVGFVCSFVWVLWWQMAVVFYTSDGHFSGSGQPVCFFPCPPCHTPKQLFLIIQDVFWLPDHAYSFPCGAMKACPTQPLWTDRT